MEVWTLINFGFLIKKTLLICSFDFKLYRLKGLHAFKRTKKAYFL